ncbi:MAG: CCA tRNA nucleotidyltransferase [Brevundimonas sp.]
MTRLSDQPWLTAPQTRAVIAALEAAGGPGCARFVGGCVRNALIDQPVDDIDIATTLPPEAVMAAVRAAGLKAVPTGLDHGTVTAVSGGQPHEVTTLRRDVSTDGRNATVAFTRDWAEDAARRDFRLNALYAAPDGEVFDPTGQGIEDALEGRIVFVGDPETRIREDYLRILRFFRFHAWYGRGPVDEAGLKACATLKDGMSRLSAERVSKELLKLLAAPDPGPAVRLMAESGVLKRVLPDHAGLTLFESMVAISPDALLRLSALLPADADRVRASARALRLSNAEKDRLVMALPAAPAVSLTMEERAGRAALYRLGRRRFEDQVMRAWAAAPERRADARRLLDQAAAWPIPRLPVNGHDAARAGASGPAAGDTLRAFEAWWVDQDFPDGDHAAMLGRFVPRSDP